MNTQIIQDGNKTILKVEGTIKTKDAAEFSAVLENTVNENAYTVIDVEQVDFICSSGLRGLLAAQTIIDSDSSKKMVLHNVSKDVMEVLEMTGFNNILVIE